ncbi:MAG: hypothetical protein QW228_04055 [Candidatus Aenigmatarchaeota archaeon]
MEGILKEVWKFHKRSIIASTLVVLSVIGLIFASSLQGRFIWVSQQPSITGYQVAVPEFSVWTILFSFIVIIFFFVIVYWKCR